MKNNLSNNPYSIQETYCFLSNSKQTIAIWSIKLICCFLTIWVLACYTGFSQTRKLPSVNVKTIDGKVFNTSKISNDGKPVMLAFWATWCGPCKKELSSLSEVYDDWKKETGVKIVAVSIDDSKSSAKVPSTVNGMGWDFEIFIDENADFKRAMNVNMPPHAFILNGKGEIVLEHVGFKEGDEDVYLNAIKKAMN